MSLIKLAVRRPIATMMWVVILLIIGVIFLRNLAVELYPNVHKPMAAIVTNYAEASSDDVNRQISEPLEEVAHSIEGTETIQVQSKTGVSFIFLKFNNEANLDQALVETKEKIEQIEGELPEKAERPKIFRFNPGQLPVVSISISGLEQEILTQIVKDELIPRLKHEDDVAEVFLQGESHREIQLILQDDQLKKYEVQPQLIKEALQNANYTEAIGKIKRKDGNLQLRIADQFQDIEEIRTTPFVTLNGEEILIGDVAIVEDVVKEPTVTSFVNDKEALVVNVMKKNNGKTTEISERIEQQIKEFKQYSPDNIDINIVFDQSQFIEHSVDSLIQNIFISSAIVLFILLLFLRSFRATLIVGLSIPISILTTFTLMYLTKQSLNLLTVSGLTLSLGMIVNSSIVVLENIYSYNERGYSIFYSITQGTKEVSRSLSAMTFTTLIAFLPILFMEETTSQLFLPFALTMAFSLFISLLVAIFIVPALSQTWLKEVFDQRNHRYWFIRLSNRLTNYYRFVLKRLLPLKKTALFITLALTSLAFLLIPRLNIEYLPLSDHNQLSIQIKTSNGNDTSQLKNNINEVNKHLQKYEKDFLVKYVTVGAQNFDELNTEENIAHIFIELVSPADRLKQTSEYVKEISDDLQAIKNAKISVTSIDADLQNLEPIVVEVKGPDFDTLHRLAEDVLHEVEQVDGTVHVHSTMGENVSQIEMNINNEKALQYRLTKEEIANQVSLYINGEVATTYEDAYQQLEIKMYYENNDFATIEDLEEIQIQTPSHERIELKEVASFTEKTSPEYLFKQNATPQVNIMSHVKNRNLKEVLNDIENKLEHLNLPEEYFYSFSGQAKDMKHSFQDLSKGIFLALCFVYIVLAISFNSLLVPLTMLFTVPTIAIGSIVSLYLTKTPFSLPVLVGLVFLIGIVVNNAIFLIDGMIRSNKSEKDLAKAIVNAATGRLRPVLMMTITTILGLIPLALALGESTKIQQPLAIIMIASFIVSLIFTLLFVPVFYTVIVDLSKRIREKSEQFMQKFNQKLNDE